MHLQLDNDNSILDVIIDNKGGLITVSGADTAVSVELTPEQIKQLAAFMSLAVKE